MRTPIPPVCVVSRSRRGSGSPNLTDWHNVVEFSCMSRPVDYSPAAPGDRSPEWESDVGYAAMMRGAVASFLDSDRTPITNTGLPSSQFYGHQSVYGHLMTLPWEVSNLPSRKPSQVELIERIREFARAATRRLVRIAEAGSARIRASALRFVMPASRLFNSAEAADT